MSNTTGPVTLGQRLRDTAAELGDEIAIRTIKGMGDYREASWAELDRRSDDIAATLLRAGVDERPATVVILTRDAVDHAAYAYGAWKAGQSILSLAPNLGDLEGRTILSRLGRTISFGQRVEWDSSERLPEPEPVSEAERQDLIARDRVPRPMMIIATGGSTGIPKLVDVLGEGRFTPGDFLGGLGRAMARVPRAKTFVCTPLSHGSGAAGSYMGMFEQCEVTSLERFDAEVAIWAIETFKLEKLSLVPTMMERIARHPKFERKRFASVQTVGHTGSKIDPAIKRAWIDLLGPEKIIEVWGSTESVGHAVITGDEWLLHPGSVGKPINCDVKIMDEDGNEVPVGEVGEIFVRPKASPVDPANKYIGTDQRMKARGEYVSVGDLGYVDADGYLYVVGRTDDLIITGGANVYPDEVEIAIKQLPEVIDCVVVGRPHHDLGEAVHAVVSVRDGVKLGLEELRSALQGRLSPYKIPRSLDVVAEISRTDAGKIRRRSYR